MDEARAVENMVSVEHAEVRREILGVIVHDGKVEEINFQFLKDEYRKHCRDERKIFFLRQDRRC